MALVASQMAVASSPSPSNRISAAAEFDKFSAEIGQARFRMEGGAKRRVGLFCGAESSPTRPLASRAATLPEDGEGYQALPYRRAVPDFCVQSELRLLRWTMASDPPLARDLSHDCYP